MVRYPEGPCDIFRVPVPYEIIFFYVDRYAAVFLTCRVPQTMTTGKCTLFCIASDPGGCWAAGKQQIKEPAK